MGSRGSKAQVFDVAAVPGNGFNHGAGVACVNEKECFRAPEICVDIGKNGAQRPIRRVFAGGVVRQEIGFPGFSINGSVPAEINDEKVPFLRSGDQVVERSFNPKFGGILIVEKKIL